MGVVTGWQGRFFEDYSVGDVYRSRLGRTITETDNIWFTNLTLNTNQSHFNTPFAGALAVRQAARQQRVHALARHRPLGHRRVGERDGQSRLGRHQAAEAGLRGRHALVRIRGARAARVGVAALRRHRQDPLARDQPARGGRDRVPAHDDGLQARGRAGAGSLPDHQTRTGASDRRPRGRWCGARSASASPQTRSWSCRAPSTRSPAGCSSGRASRRSTAAGMPRRPPPSACPTSASRARPRWSTTRAASARPCRSP